MYREVLEVPGAAAHTNYTAIANDSYGVAGFFTDDDQHSRAVMHSGPTPGIALPMQDPPQVLGPYGANSTAHGVLTGEFVIGTVDRGGVVSATFWEQGKPALDMNPILGTSWSTGHGFNQTGHVVGAASFNSPPDPSMVSAYLCDTQFFYPGTTAQFIDLGVLPGHRRSVGWAVNAHLQVVGTSTVESWTNGVLRTAPFPFIYERGEMRLLVDRPGRAVDINDQGQVLVQLRSDSDWATAGQSHGYIWSNGEIHDLPADVFGYAINDAGAVVGCHEEGPGRPRTAVRCDPGGALTDLNTAGPMPSNVAADIAFDINDLGQVLVRCWSGGGPGGQVSHRILVP